MSQRDLEQNRAALVAFKGRRCFASLHTNSIRFRIDDSEKQGRYIWIDPPWMFSHERKEITSWDAYSDDGFKKWCQLFEPLRNTVLQDFEEEEHGAVTLIFADSYRLFVPIDSESEEDDSDYDHWYAYDKAET
jgi:hypothetical protein